MRAFNSFNDDELDELYGSNPSKAEFIEFLHKVDWEGGFESFLDWGGVKSLPEELQSAGRILEEARSTFRDAVNALEEKYGVQY